jgi:hypothetical protein
MKDFEMGDTPTVIEICVCVSIAVIVLGLGFLFTPEGVLLWELFTK